MEAIPCECGCGKSINRYDPKGRERRFHKDCFSPLSRKFSVGARKHISKRAGEPNRIKLSMEKINKVNIEIKTGKRIHPCWNGGYLRSRDDGYLMVKKPDHPRANNNGYVFVHILVAEEGLGRPLRDGETIHHINRNRQDNRPENISVKDSPGIHQHLHAVEDNRRDERGRFASYVLPKEVIYAGV